MSKPLLIGISGGTGSGKTRFTKELISRFDDTSLICISQDSYYKDLSEICYDERCNVNFDSPDSIDFLNLLGDLENLMASNPVDIPIYNFKRHIRMKESEMIEPKPVIILEGIFSLYKPEIRALMDLKIFVDTPPDIRILRRAKRDINKRERTIESIAEQYLKTVKPMHEKYIEPTKSYADIIVPNGGKNKIALDIINSQLLPMMEDKIKDADS
jgi:uridine kinase